jgi:hypothetical protein
MEFRFRDIGAADLRVHIEADLEVLDGDAALYAEKLFPVAEQLMRWKSSGRVPPDDFVFDSMSFAECRVLPGFAGVAPEHTGYVASVTVCGAAAGRKAAVRPYGGWRTLRAGRSHGHGPGGQHAHAAVPG